MEKEKEKQNGEDAAWQKPQSNTKRQEYARLHEDTGPRTRSQGTGERHRFQQGLHRKSTCGWAEDNTSRRFVSDLNIKKTLNPYVAVGYLANTKWCKKTTIFLIETLANGYSSEGAQRELSNEYQQD